MGNLVASSSKPEIAGPFSDRQRIVVTQNQNLENVSKVGVCMLDHMNGVSDF
jgi:hypothetical protein